MMKNRTTAFDWDARIALQHYVGDVTRASYTPGFTFLRFETFACGGQRHEVAIFRNDLFAEALGLKPDYPQFTRHYPSVTNIACEFVLIPGGTCMMGDEEDRWSEEKPQHRVNVSMFLLARTQCTEAVWDGIARLKGPDLCDERDQRGGRRNQRDDRQPITGVSWDDVQKFERATGLRLPSEAEWEYACRAGTTTPFYFGDDDDDLGDYAWYSGNSLSETHPVGEKRPNAFGLFDMNGNVYEWCEDRWHDDYNGAPTDGSAWTDGTSGSRVRRGGSWFGLPLSHRSPYRSRARPGGQSIHVGFRPACSILLSFQIDPY